MNRLHTRHLHSRTKSRRKAMALGGIAALFAAGLVAAGPVQASHGVATLSGSNFEIDNDANLKVDDAAPSVDWASFPNTGVPNEIRATDAVNGTGDNSYAGGVKEDTVCPGEKSDSIPPNKSDLLSFHVYREAGTGTHPGFLNLAWSRVSDPSGTTLMDFEFNKSSTACASGPNVVRTAGDLLIEYAIDQGGSRADITARTWTGTAWGPTTDLDVPSATCGGGPCAAGTICVCHVESRTPCSTIPRSSAASGAAACSAEIPGANRPMTSSQLSPRRVAKSGAIVRPASVTGTHS